MLEARKAKFFDNEELTSRPLATSPRPSAREAKYDRRWGIGCTFEETQWSMEWNGSNLLGDELIELGNTLEAERIATEYSGNLFRE